MTRRYAAAFLVCVAACMATYSIYPLLVSAQDISCPVGKVYTLKCGEKEKDKNGEETGKVGGQDCVCTETENGKTVTGLCKPFGEDNDGKCFITKTAEGEKPKLPDVCNTTVGCDPQSIAPPQVNAGAQPPALPSTPTPNQDTDPKPNTVEPFKAYKNPFDEQLEKVMQGSGWLKDSAEQIIGNKANPFTNPWALTPQTSGIGSLAEQAMDEFSGSIWEVTPAQTLSGFEKQKDFTDPFFTEEDLAELSKPPTPAELAAAKLNNYEDTRSYWQKLKDSYDTGDLFDNAAWAKNGDPRDKKIIEAAYEKLYAQGYTDKDLANLRNDPKKLAAVQNAFFEAASEAGRIHPAFKNDKQYFFEHLNSRYTQESTSPLNAEIAKNGSGIAQLTAPAIKDVWGFVRNDARTDDAMNVLTGAAFENKIGVEKNHADPYDTSLVYKGKNNNEFAYASKVEARTEVFSKAFDATLAGKQATIAFDDRFDASSATAAEWREIVKAQAAYLSTPAPINNSNGGFAEYNEIFAPPAEAAPFSHYGLAGQEVVAPYAVGGDPVVDSGTPLATETYAPVDFDAEPPIIAQTNSPKLSETTAPQTFSLLDPALQEKAPAAAWPPPVQARAPIAGIPPTDVIGDSLGDGIRAAGNLPGDTMRNRTISQILEATYSYVDKFNGDMTGRHVVVPLGSNSPWEVEKAADVIEALQDAGAKVTVVGVGPRPDIAPINTRLEAIAREMGAEFQPVQGVGRDRVHPGAQGYAETLAAISAKSEALLPANIPPLKKVETTFQYAEAGKYFGNTLPTSPVTAWQPDISNPEVFAYTPPVTSGPGPSAILQEVTSPQQLSMLGTDNPAQGISGGLLNPVADKSVIFDASSISAKSLQPYSTGITLDDFDDYVPAVTPIVANTKILEQYPPIDFDSEPFPVTQTSALSEPPITPQVTVPPETPPLPIESSRPAPTYLESQQLFGARGEPLTPEEAARLNTAKAIGKEPDTITSKTVTKAQPPNVAKADDAVDTLKSRVTHMKTLLNNAVATGQIDWLNGVKAIHSAQSALSEANKTIAGLKGTDSDFEAISAASKSLTETSSKLNELKVALATYSTSAVVSGMQKHGAEMTKSMNNAVSLVHTWSNALPDPPTSVETTVVPGKSFSYDIPVMKGGGEPFLYADAPTTFSIEPSAASQLAYTWDPDGPSGEFFEYDSPPVAPIAAAPAQGSPTPFTGSEPIELATAPVQVEQLTPIEIDPSDEYVSLSQQTPVLEPIVKVAETSAPPAFHPPALDDSWAVPEPAFSAKPLDEKPVPEYGPLVSWSPTPPAPVLTPAPVAVEPRVVKSDEQALLTQLAKPRLVRGLQTSEGPLPNSEPITGKVPLPKPAPFIKHTEPINPSVGSNGYSGVSLVEYLKQSKLDTSYASRKERWAEYVQAGLVSGPYTGRAWQNREILRRLRGY